MDIHLIPQKDEIEVGDVLLYGQHYVLMIIEDEFCNLGAINLNNGYLETYGKESMKDLLSYLNNSLSGNPTLIKNKNLVLGQK